ncbi:MULTISPECIES: SDR family oxidoreductase [Streptomyces]|uniref:SDR family oxidoreductase n=1 Tax=Streptomyces TaxID=1883 RepID=UPI0029B419C6|nr:MULTISPECIES: sugar nucleotide-binding protein [Streptomyces]MDX2636018.1 sugar nucleotide-binding protein [Streptomyces stelliscabiei]MDX3199593.1 sugar nucleotide-binding protein [Streptomyces scabiei]MDX3216490.1 sugar nucleotide-binding protein [Streptomyces scabiei]
MTLLIIGASGFLGGELVRQTTASGHAVAGTFVRNPGRLSGVKWLPLDLHNREEIVSVLDEVHPHVVINAASRKADWATTAEGAIRVAMAAAGRGARLVHVSSDAVFSGAQVHYDEAAVPDPITPYGAAKAAAETAIRLLAPAAVIARTSLIIGDGDSEHEKFVHELSDGRRDGALFTDDVRCPVHVSDLAAAILELASSDHAGIRHVAGRDAVSRHELGLLIARRDGLAPSTLPAGRRADAGVPGPLDVRLDSSGTQHRLRTRVRGAHEFLSGEGADTAW